MTPEVEEAIEEIRQHFKDCKVLVGPDKDGGACVIVEDLPLGAPYGQSHSWVGFHITHACPYADVYPHFMRGDLARADKKPLGELMTQNHKFPQPGVVEKSTIPPRPAVQISRRSNKRDPQSDLETPLIKLLKVLRWVMSC